MLYGGHPFNESKNSEELQAKILKKEINFNSPQKISDKVLKLLKSMLKKDMCQRITFLASKEEFDQIYVGKVTVVNSSSEGGSGQNGLRMYFEKLALENPNADCENRCSWYSNLGKFFFYVAESIENAKIKYNLIMDMARLEPLYSIFVMSSAFFIEQFSQMVKLISEIFNGKEKDDLLNKKEIVDMTNQGRIIYTFLNKNEIKKKVLLKGTWTKFSMMIYDQILAEFMEYLKKYVEVTGIESIPLEHLRTFAFIGYSNNFSSIVEILKPPNQADFVYSNLLLSDQKCLIKYLSLCISPS